MLQSVVYIYITKQI